MTAFLFRILGTAGIVSAAILAMATVAAQAFAQSTPVRMLVPDLTISGDANDIVAASSLLIAPNGNIILLGRGDYRGKVFAPTGSLIRSFARTGQGPGEIAATFAPLQNAGMAGDTLWIYLNRRIGLYTSDGSFIRYVSYRGGESAWQTGRPDWAWMNRSVIPARLLPGGSAIAVPNVGLEVVRSAVYPTTGQPLLRMTWEGEVTGAPLMLPLQNIFFRTSAVGNSFQQVLAHMPKYAFSADGRRIVIANVRDAAPPGAAPPYVELLHLSTAGDTIATHRVGFAPDPIQRRSVDSVIARFTAPMPAGRRPPDYQPPQLPPGIESEMRNALIVPRYWSPFSEVKLANDGTTWLKWHVPGNDLRWLVVSPRGETLMQAEQPPSARIMVIDGAIWGASMDSVGFVNLMRFTVRDGR
jgi:hypothetical protein